MPKIANFEFKTENSTPSLDHSDQFAIYKSILRSLINALEAKELVAIDEAPDVVKTIDTVKKLPKDGQIALFDFVAEAINLKELLSEIISFLNLSNNHPDRICIEQRIINHDLHILLILLLIKPFVCGFGGISPASALLTCAQIASRKHYQFNPIVLSEKQLSCFLQLLANSPIEPLRVRFVLSGQHWRAGDIEIRKGEIRAVLIDSLGLDQRDIEKTKIVLATMVKHLTVPDKKLQIYFDPTKRQYSRKGCSVFCLDDLQHLFTLERYLDVSLFDYLDKQTKARLAIDENYTVQVIQLPLVLLRTLQSRKLVQSILPARRVEAARPINKKGQTTNQCVARFFQSDKDGNLVGQNRLIEEILRKFGLMNLRYLLTHSLTTGLENMRNFTYEHCMKTYMNLMAQHISQAPDLNYKKYFS